MEIKRCLKIRLYPTPEQFQMFIKTGGCRRFVYNKYVEAREHFYADNISGLFVETGSPIRENG